MGMPFSLLAGARAFARDYPRDQMPAGYLWDVVDYVPTLIDTSLTGRGSWKWGSDAMAGNIQGGVLASFSTGEQLLVITDAGNCYSVDQVTGALTLRGGVPGALQNPIQYLDNA